MSTNNVSLDIDYVKAQFPAFSDPLSSKWSFFENAGGSYVPHNVIQHLNQFMISLSVFLEEGSVCFCWWLGSGFSSIAFEQTLRFE